MSIWVLTFARISGLIDEYGAKAGERSAESCDRVQWLPG